MFNKFDFIVLENMEIAFARENLGARKRVVLRCYGDHYLSYV